MCDYRSEWSSELSRQMVSLDDTDKLTKTLSKHMAVRLILLGHLIYLPKRSCCYQVLLENNNMLTFEKLSHKRNHESANMVMNICFSRPNIHSDRYCHLFHWFLMQLLWLLWLISFTLLFWSQVIYFRACRALWFFIEGFFMYLICEPNIIVTWVLHQLWNACAYCGDETSTTTWLHFPG